MNSVIEANLPCPVCKRPMDIRPTKGRKSGKPSLMFICPENGRHFRGFIADQTFVRQVLSLLEGPQEDQGSNEEENSSSEDTDLLQN